MPQQQAKTLGAEMLRELRYGPDRYFRADTEEGVNLEDTDQHGTSVVTELLAKAQAGGGYAEYRVPKKGERTAQPKRACVQPFKPFGWVVGTGYYR